MSAQQGNIDSRILPHLAEIKAWRHDLHRHPELSYDVHRTAGFVAEQLRSFGVDEVVEGIGQTGVVGVINGKSCNSGICIGLRADMDALPIDEDTQAEYASTIKGKMHACGHDGHTAMLLGAAKVLSDTRRFNGTAVVIFQPAEESGAGGQAMVQDGLMERFHIQKVFGMHNLPNMPLGQFGVRTGPIMASADVFDITLTGKGGHAALPHLCVDTLVVAAQVITALQTVASRNTDPIDSVVVSVTSVNANSDSYNVIPQTVKLKGTVRSLRAETQDAAESQVHRIVKSTAEALGASADINYVRDYPATINSAAEAVFAAQNATRVVGESNVDDNTPPMLGSEDFSFMLNERPGAFIFVGNGSSASLHHPQYDFNDDAIQYGSSYWLSLIENAMPQT